MVHMDRGTSDVFELLKHTDIDNLGLFALTPFSPRYIETLAAERSAACIIMTILWRSWRILPQKIFDGRLIWTTFWCIKFSRMRDEWTPPATSTKQWYKWKLNADVEMQNILRNTQHRGEQYDKIIIWLKVCSRSFNSCNLECNTDSFNLNMSLVEWYYSFL